MNKMIVSIICLALFAAAAPRAFAQDNPPPPRGDERGDHSDGGGGDGGGRRRPPPPDDDRHQQQGGDDEGGHRRPPPPRPDGQGGPGGPSGGVRVPPEMAVIQGYLNLVDQFYRLAKDPAATGVSAVLGANDLLKSRGADAGIAYFTKILPDVKNEVVQRAIRLQLIDLYKKSNQAEKALEQMQMLMTIGPEKATESPSQTR